MKLSSLLFSPIKIAGQVREQVGQRSSESITFLWTDIALEEVQGQGPKPKAPGQHCLATHASRVQMYPSTKAIQRSSSWWFLWGTLWLYQKSPSRLCPKVLVPILSKLWDTIQIYRMRLAGRLRNIITSQSWQLFLWTCNLRKHSSKADTGHMIFMGTTVEAACTTLIINSATNRNSMLSIYE